MATKRSLEIGNQSFVKQAAKSLRVENRDRHNYRPSTRSYNSVKSIYRGDFLPKIAPVSVYIEKLI